jgi:mannose-1-phosphate guanylyltransferase
MINNKYLDDRESLHMVCVVIMAGGRGERFWPKSRLDTPKQFTGITGDGNMLYLTYKRVEQLTDKSGIFVVTGKDYKDITKACLPEIPEENIILEPEGRNTAPCIGLAAIILDKRFFDATMVVVPADHYIKDEATFAEDLRIAINLAETTNGLITLGIKPNRAETGYGYLKVGEIVTTSQDKPVYKVGKFVEKPDLVKAKQFLSDGSYLWNGGIFIWKVSVILNAFKDLLPGIYEGLQKIAEFIDTKEYNDILDKVYPTLDRISVDYGIMEKAEQVYTVAGDFSWDDVGTWKSLERVFDADQDGNVIQGNVIHLDARNSIIQAGKRLVAVIGVEDMVIVDTEDITFVCHKDKTDSVRELLTKMRSQNLERYL